MKEFILMMASLMALVALSIDAMLPALGLMGQDLHVARANDMQFVISFIFIGMTLGQVVYGPLADAIGRKRSLYIALGTYVVGCAISWQAESLPVMLVGRLLQGFGVAGPRIVTLAIIRDKYQGRDMAYVMSMVMGVFIMVPALAPSVGQGIIHVAGWRAIYGMYLAAALGLFLWTSMRLEETLTDAHRRPFNVRSILSGFKEAAATRVTMGYTLCCGFAFGAMLGYLNSSQQIFQEMFHVGDRFALYFGMLAMAIGTAFFSNSALVRKLGMRRITRAAITTMMAASALFLPYVLLAPPSLVAFMLFMAVAFFCLGLMFGNMTAMAMEPMGHMAGLASAFSGAFSTAMSLLLGIAIGQLFNGTLVPLAVGFLSLSIACRLTMHWAEKGQA